MSERSYHGATSRSLTECKSQEFIGHIQQVTTSRVTYVTNGIQMLYQKFDALRPDNTLSGGLQREAPIRLLSVPSSPRLRFEPAEREVM